MKVEYELLPNFDLSLGLGFFDGVHLAHQKIINKTVSLARENGLKSGIITFLKSPIECFYPEKNPKYLMTNSQKIEILKSMGVDYLYLLDFNSIKKYCAKDYLRDVLYKNFRPKFITTGFNNHFGKDRGGDLKMLENYSDEFKYTYFRVEPQKIDGTLISSTKIRSFIRSAELETAKKFLGRDFEVEGEVVMGNQLGRTMGFPTANLIWNEKIEKLPHAVYMGTATLKGTKYRALINWGERPTIDKKEILEVHLLDFNEDIYGEKLAVSFEKKIRNQTRFNNVEELKFQILADYSSLRLL